MKNTIFTLGCLLLFLFATNAQILFGTTFNGGAGGGGTINKLGTAANTFTTVASLQSVPLSPDRCHFIQATDGKLYGMTKGINSGVGGAALFSFDPSNGAYTKLKDFDYNNDGVPKGKFDAGQ